MDAHRLTALVQEAAGIDEGHAARAIAATLATLAERLDRGEARDLADELPPELAAWLATNTPAARFGVDEFIRRVAEREGADAATAERDARAVLTALGHARARRARHAARGAHPGARGPAKPLVALLGRFGMERAAGGAARQGRRPEGIPLGISRVEDTAGTAGRRPGRRRSRPAGGR